MTVHDGRLFMVVDNSVTNLWEIDPDGADSTKAHCYRALPSSLTFPEAMTIYRQSATGRLLIHAGGDGLWGDRSRRGG